MKQLTLDETWERCLAMWKWIDWHVARNKHLEVYDLKKEWLENNSPADNIEEGCFLCHKAILSHSNKKKKLRKKSEFALIECPCCPARKIDPGFYCMKYNYNFDTRPRLFYAKLKKLNKIRLERKSK